MYVGMYIHVQKQWRHRIHPSRSHVGPRLARNGGEETTRWESGWSQCEEHLPLSNATRRRKAKAFDGTWGGGVEAADFHMLQMCAFLR